MRDLWARHGVSQIVSLAWLPGPFSSVVIGWVEASPTTDRFHLDTGEALIREGDETDTVYLLLGGSLTVSHRVDNETAVIAVIDEPGSLVGEMVALSGGSRTATVVAQEPAELISIPVDEFRRLLSSNPGLADALVQVATRRAEEGELADLLANHFGIVDDSTLITTCASVAWTRLASGEVLFREGEASNSAYFVVRGRLKAERSDPDGSQQTVGEMGRGDVVGEVGLLGHKPRTATVTAIRDTVVAEMTEATFLGLIEGRPNVMIELYLDAVARSESSRGHSAPSTVIGFVASDRVDVELVIKEMLTELNQHGEARRLSPFMVDETLGFPGIFNAEGDGIEDVRISRLVHETELEADFLLVELGRQPGPWVRRVLGMVDRLLVAVTPDLDPQEESDLRSLVGSPRPGVQRTAVVVHPSRQQPTGSGELKRRLGAENVVHVERSSGSDLARLARMSVGRANSLVLSGGGARGFAHIGVYRALIELGFPIDLVGGTSMGAVLGAVIAAGMTPDEVVSRAKSGFADALDYTLPLLSLTKGARIARLALETFEDAEIEDLWLGYFALSTDLTAARPHVHESGSIASAIRASSAIPGVLPPVPYGEALLIDGGVLNNLPIDVARIKSPLGRIVASDVAPPRGPGAHGDYGLSVSGWRVLRQKFRRGRSPYPAISAVLMRSMITASMQERDAQVDEGLADCYLDLDIRGVSMLDFASPAEVARRGYEAARPALESWLGDSDRDSTAHFQSVANVT